MAEPTPVQTTVETPIGPLPVLLSIPLAMEAVGVSRRTIYNWMRTGKVEYVRTAGGNVQILTLSLWRTGTEAVTR